MWAWQISSADIWVLPIYQYRPKWPIYRCGQNAVIFLMHPDNLLKKAQRSKSRQLSCSNASRYGFINKQTRLTMEHALALAAETKASSLIRLIKNHSKRLKLLQFENFNPSILIFEVFEKKVRHRINNILIMKQKTRFKNFGNIGYWSMNGQYIGIGIGHKKAVLVDL